MIETLDKILLQSGLIIPLKREDVNILADACTSFVNGDSFSFSVFEALVICYLKNEEFPQLSDYIKEFIENNDETNTEFPWCINHAAVFFCIYMAIEGCGNSKTKAIRSLSLQNAILRIHGKWNTIKYAELLCSLYFKSVPYLEKVYVGAKKYPSEFAQSMFDDDSRVGEDIDDEMLEDIRSLVLFAFDAEMGRFIKDLDESNPFMRIVYILEYFFENMPQLPKQNDFYQLESMIFSGKEGKMMKIGNIIGYIAMNKRVLTSDVVSESSIILKRVKNLRLHRCYEEIGSNMRLKPSEFFVYLYHEMLLEALLNG